MATVTSQSRAGAIRSAELAIGGMTCASCAARIEKKLNKLDGVAATVNFATETARLSFPASVSTGDLISVVEQAGYTSRGVREEDPPGRGVTGGSPPGEKQRRTRCGGDCWCRWPWRSRSWCWPWCLRCSSGTGSGYRWRWPRR